MIREFKKGERNELSYFFTSLEFDCHCSYPNCEVTYVDDDLIKYLTSKRELFDKPIQIVSGFRCVKHNSDVGGKPGSIHLIGKAADIQIPGYDMVKIADKFEDADGLGKYPGRHFLHVDLRGHKSRWVG